MKQREFRLSDISMRGLIVELLRNIWVILLSGLSVWLAVTGIGQILYSPQYSANATMVVRVKGSDDALSSLSMASSMTTVFSNVFQSNALRDKISDDIGNGISGTITCSQIPETNLLKLTATSSDPRQAYLFMSSALEHYDELSEYIFSNATLEVLLPPSVPDKPSNSPLLSSQKSLVALIAMVGASGVIVLLYWLRFTVKTEASAKDLLDGKVLGTIPYEKKPAHRGRNKIIKSLLINSPLVSMSYAESSRQLAQKISWHMHKKEQKILLVTSIGENEGKSTVAANIALALAECHKRVLLIDGDFRKPAQYKLFEQSRENRISFSDLILKNMNISADSLYNKSTKLFELFQLKAFNNPSEFFNSPVLPRFLDEIKKEMDYIIIDCSPIEIGTDAERLMMLSNTVLVVVRQDWSDVRAINDAADTALTACGDFAGFALNAFKPEWFTAQADTDYGRYKITDRGENRGK